MRLLKGGEETVRAKLMAPIDVTWERVGRARFGGDFGEAKFMVRTYKKLHVQNLYTS